MDFTLTNYIYKAMFLFFGVDVKFGGYYSTQYRQFKRIYKAAKKYLQNIIKRKPWSVSIWFGAVLYINIACLDLQSKTEDVLT